jgi:hypothetical protein
MLISATPKLNVFWECMIFRLIFSCDRTIALLVCDLKRRYVFNRNQYFVVICWNLINLSTRN